MAKIAFFVASAFACLVFGALTAMAPELMARFAILATLALVVVVAAIQPDVGELSGKSQRRFLTLLFVVTVFWPSFLTLRIPGMPTIDPRRIVAVLGLGMLAYLLIARRSIRSRVFKSGPMANFMLLLLMVMTAIRFVTAFSAPYPVLALPIAFWEFAGIFSVGLVALIILRKQDVLPKLHRLSMWAICICAVIALAEVASGRTLVVDAFGRFASADSTLASALSLSRVRDGFLRAQGPFEHSLPFSEFACVTFSLAAARLLWPAANPTQDRTLTIAGAVASVISVALSGSRSGLLCLVVAMVWIAVVKFVGPARGRRLGGFEAGLRLGAMALLLVMFAGVLVPLARNLVRGNSVAQSQSSESRAIMVKKGLSAFMEAPGLGHGIGTGVEIAGVLGSGRVPTLDNYLILVGVESGVPYAVMWIVLFVLPAIWASHKVLVGNAGPPWFMVGGAAALLSMLVMRSVLAINYNLPIALLLIGLMLQCTAQQRVRAVPFNSGRR